MKMIINLYFQLYIEIILIYTDLKVIHYMYLLIVLINQKFMNLNSISGK